MATKLEELIIREVSGVDDPANEIPGFMVIKNRAGNATLGTDLSLRIAKAAAHGNEHAAELLRRACTALAKSRGEDPDEVFISVVGTLRAYARVEGEMLATYRQAVQAELAGRAA